MTTARNWLADQNLAIRGAKGKFSTIALAALARHIQAGNKFEDWDANGRVKPGATGTETVRVVKIKPARVSTLIKRDMHAVRRESKMRIVDKRGTIIVLDTHSGKDSCNRPIKFCMCKNLKPPHYIDVASFSIEV